ncbi:MAG: hypothetical protein ACLGIN_02845 [Candidatus Sericytochromatia bacterium]
MALLFQLKTYVAARAWLVLLLTFVLAATGLTQNPTRRIDASAPADMLTRPALKLKVRGAYRSKPVNRYGLRDLGEVTTRRNVAHGKPHDPDTVSDRSQLALAVPTAAGWRHGPASPRDWARPGLGAGSAPDESRRTRAPPLLHFLA